MSLRGRVNSILFVLLVLSVFLLSGCGGTNATPSSQATGTSKSTQAADTQGTPAATNPHAGDIPDTQAFVKYRSTQGGYELEVPEGWAQSITATGISFTDKFNNIQVQLAQAKTTPSVASVRSNEVVTLQQTGNAVQDVKVQSTQLASGTAILITYSANSDANAVTGKQIRLENNRYLFFHNGKLATLTLSAPLGADNVDQWARIARSFRWV